jgi:hypothetical protein
MGILEPTAQYALLGLLLASAVTFLLFQPTSLVRWLQKKNYQYEVTFALYMLTPVEKFIFSALLTPLAPFPFQPLANNDNADSILFLTFSLFTLATVLYLPDHVLTISRRTYYYFAGDAALSDLSSQAYGTIGNVASKASEAVLGTATGFAGNAYQAAVNTAAVAQEAMNQAAETMGWG